MALEQAFGTLAPTATGSLSVTGLTFQPKLVLFYSVAHRSPGGGSLEVIAASSYGAASSSANQGTIGNWIQGGTGIASSTVVSNASCIHVPNPNAIAVITRIDFTSMNADGFTVNVVTVNGTWDARIQYLALGGDDLTNAKVLEFATKGSTGTQAYTGAGFQPDGLILFMSAVTGLANPQNQSDHPHLSYGAANIGGQFGLSMCALDSSGTSIAKSKLLTDKCLVHLDDDGVTISKEAALSSFDPDGFTLNYTTADAQAYRGFAVLFEGPSFKVGSVSQKTSTGTQGYTGVGFQPKALGLFGIGRPASTSIQADAVFQHGMGVNATERGSAWVRLQDNDSSPTTEALFETDSIVDHYDVSNTLLYSADLDSLDADGFTLDFTTADATAREIAYWAFGDAGVGPEIINRSGETSPTVTQTASYTGDFTKAAENTLTVTQEIVLTDQSFNVSASNTLVFDQTALFSGSIYADAETTVNVVQSGDFAETLELSAENTLTVTQTAVQSGPIVRDAETTLTIAHSADLTEKNRSATHTLTVTQTVEESVSKLVRTELAINQEAQFVLVGRTATSVLTPVQVAKLVDDAITELTIISTAEVVPEPGTKMIFHTLNVTQSVGLNVDRTLSASTTLTVTQTPRNFIIGETITCTFSPFGNLTMPTPSQPAHTKGITLTYPLDGSTFNVALSRSMNLGDKDRFGFDRINRETRGGQLLIFADPQWPKNQTLAFTMSGLSRTEATAVLNFLGATVGREIGLLTHEGFQWKGIITNPQEALVQDHRNSYTASIEFEGEIV